MHRYWSVLLLSAALAAPLSVKADDKHSDNQTKRYYDSSARDWHEWNQNEDRAYHQYLTESHKKDHDIAKANRGEKKDYFKWRHEHPDQDRH
jgi:hypothetical protein